MNRPSVDIAVELSKVVRESDEWFEEADDLARLTHAISLTESAQTPLDLAAAVAFRVAYSQAFTEGNKRTALLLAIWVMDNNGHDRKALVLGFDEALGALLVKAASGHDVEAEIYALFKRRQDGV